MSIQRRLAAAYFAALGVGVAAWWAVLLAIPASRPPFLANGVSFAELQAFAPGDILVLAPGALLTAYGIAKRAGWAPSSAAFVAGVTIYASAYAVTSAVTLGASAVGLALMAPLLVLSPLAWWLARRE